MCRQIFYTRSLLDFPKENLNLPVIFVNIGDGPGRQSKMVGQKFVIDVTRCQVSRWSLELGTDFLPYAFRDF
jgi:hypothetical protein